MKVLKGNIAKCGHCSTVMEYDENDVISVVLCPECNSAVRVQYPVVAQPTVSKPFSDMSWEEIKECVQAHSAKVFELGAKKEITLKDGEKYFVQVVDRKDGLVIGFVDLFGRKVDFDNGHLDMLSDDGEPSSSYEDSNTNCFLNSEFYDLLPDDFKEVICETEIDAGADLISVNVFIPSEMEVFGKKINATCQEGEQFELYKDWHNRIAGKRENEYGSWYWLRSIIKPTHSTVYFCSVTSNGHADYGNAGDSYYVRPHFKIK
jgi:hypothetical protein